VVVECVKLCVKLFDCIKTSLDTLRRDYYTTFLVYGADQFLSRKDIRKDVFFVRGLVHNICTGKKMKD
jgi:hypothetical protein